MNGHWSYYTDGFGSLRALEAIAPLYSWSQFQNLEHLAWLLGGSGDRMLWTHPATDRASIQRKRAGRTKKKGPQVGMALLLRGMMAEIAADSAMSIPEHGRSP